MSTTTKYMLTVPNVFDGVTFKYAKIKPNPTGGKVVNLNIEQGVPIICVTDAMFQWGAQEAKDQAGNPTGKYSVSFQFSDPNSAYATPESNNVLENIKAFEAKIKKDALKHSLEWFGKNISSEDVMAEKFNDMLRYPRIEKGSTIPDYTRAPTFSGKLPRWKKGDKQVWKTEVYSNDHRDEQGELAALFTENDSDDHCPMEFIPDKCRAIGVLQLGGLWFVNGKCSITWNLMQIIIQSPPAPVHVTGQCMIPQATIAALTNTSNTSDEFESSNEFKSSDTGATTSCTMVDESDDEQETTEAEADEEVIVAPVETKSKGKKKGGRAPP